MKWPGINKVGEQIAIFREYLKKHADGCNPVPSGIDESRYQG